MKILFSQMKPKENQVNSMMENFGMAECYLKLLFFENDYKNTTLKMHHHTNFEIHMVMKGSQIYEVSGEFIRVNQGQFLLISPLVKHKVVSTDPDTEKISITFNAVKGGIVDLSVKNINEFVSDQIPYDTENNISYILKESKTKREYCYYLISGRVFECVMQIMRVSGIKDIIGRYDEEREDARVSIAKQYINDNVKKNISVQDVAIYCNLSVKQLSRIFKEKEVVGVAEYIRNEKSKHISKLLLDKKMTLKEISEKMGFNNEYYFNTFVKKNLGMTPGEYRKTLAEKN